METARGAAAGPRPAPLREGSVPKPVVGGALLRVLEHLVGLGDLFEHLLRLFIARVFVRMVLNRFLAVGLFQLLLRDLPRHAEQFVVVFLCHG